MVDRRHLTTVAALLVGVVALSFGQQNDEQVTVPFSNPSRPGSISISLVQGSISVKGANRKDVLVVTRPEPERLNRRSADAVGLRRLPQTAGFKIEEEFNEMRIGSGNPNRSMTFEIQAPLRTNLNLKTVNGGDIVVDGIEGDLEVQNTNGSITLTGIAGSVVANTTNGNVLVTLTRVTAQKAMAFTSLNGSVDVTLPASTKANLKLRSDNGDVYTDFDVQLRPGIVPTVRDNARDGGRYRISVNKSVVGSINGGGPEFELRTFNSNVYVRKGR